ncbi:MAG: phosphoribosyltransferase family protein [Bacillota bacterium]|nr:phosphoribosyltransferase family protein [Bacillota bacterium]
MKRGERFALWTQRLVSEPGRRFSLDDLRSPVGTPKSTISGDLADLKRFFAEEGIGQVETWAGAAGGVRFRPLRSPEVLRRWAEELREELSEENRVLPGGLLYLQDILFDPFWAQRIGEILASWFAPRDPQYVLTVETRGVPPALFAARALGVKMVLARRTSRPAEGPAVYIHYRSQSSDRLQTMSLARRALPPGSRVLIVDDFMRGGGTLRGMEQLLEEFSCQVAGRGVVLATAIPEEKAVRDFASILWLEEVREGFQPRLRLGHPSGEGDEKLW